MGFQTGLMNVGLDLVGEMLILLRHGQGYPKRQFERECLAVTVDGADSDGSLKAVGGTHGVLHLVLRGSILRAFLSIT